MLLLLRTQRQDTITLPLTSKPARNPSTDGCFLSLTFFARLRFDVRRDKRTHTTDLGNSWSDVKCSIHQNKCETLGNLSIRHSPETSSWMMILVKKGEEWDLNPIRSRWSRRRRRPELISFTLTRRVSQRPKLSTRDQKCQLETKVVIQRPKGILVNIVIWKTATFIEIFWSCHGTVRRIALHTVSMCDHLEQST